MHGGLVAAAAVVAEIDAVSQGQAQVLSLVVAEVQDEEERKKERKTMRLWGVGFALGSSAERTRGKRRGWWRWRSRRCRGGRR